LKHENLRDTGWDSQWSDFSELSVSLVQMLSRVSGVSTLFGWCLFLLAIDPVFYHFCTTLGHEVCWVKVNPLTAEKMFEYIFVMRFLPSNEIVNKKHTLFNTVSHHGSTQTLKMLTANWTQEQMCSDKWKSIMHLLSRYSSKVCQHMNHWMLTS
jgi:hypothetical protein